MFNTQTFIKNACIKRKDRMHLKTQSPLVNDYQDLKL